LFGTTYTAVNGDSGVRRKIRARFDTREQQRQTV
jgi:hypothetical protein